jgi:20S proteasome alpha/beta subunit
VAAKRLPFSKFQAKPIRKLFRVDDHIVIGATGLLFDANAMADVAERLCRNYKSIYDSPIPLENLCDELATIFHRQTKSASSRPLGISLLVAGWDDEFGPQLYEVDPEGSVTAWNAASVGKGEEEIGFWIVS